MNLKIKMIVMIMLFVIQLACLFISMRPKYRDEISIFRIYAMIGFIPVILVKLI